MTNFRFLKWWPAAILDFVFTVPVPNFTNNEHLIYAGYELKLYWYRELIFNRACINMAGILMLLLHSVA